MQSYLNHNAALQLTVKSDVISVQRQMSSTVSQFNVIVYVNFVFKALTLTNDLRLCHQRLQ